MNVAFLQGPRRGRPSTLLGPDVPMLLRMRGVGPGKIGSIVPAGTWDKLFDAPADPIKLN